MGGAEPSFDTYDNTPELIPLRDAAYAGDWAAVRAFFGRLGSVDDMITALNSIAETPGVERWLERAAADFPADPLPRTLLAKRYVIIGWDIRSAALAKDVSREQFDQFHAWLRRAEQLLIQVCAEQPSYAPAWYIRITLARGLELGTTEARRRYDRLRAHHPHVYGAQAALLQQLCPKWGGTWEEAHGFAAEATREAPDGAPTGVLVADAHIEHWLSLEGQGGPYLRGLNVLHDLRNAAAISVRHPAYRPDLSSLYAHGTFALAFSLGGHHADAAPHFAALGDRAAGPWSYLSDPKAAFRRYRKSAREAVAR
ncbi:hypothetical protein [Streptomyces acidiscabies]|uniref:DUF4034 domain-containing protein n=1 Tax=Streptomyces acidiscabies TaxID=42234 RepID=A0AAP6EJ84_9ACTN|nr:hypothetical protein [Streptomyces acidiscabies]MBP5937513.1 hypothetical protein [Streptomyces sp. LBUM 1476]MBZ3914398.1 hypothetical protein [Streptomyces acidiscabies]MDX2964266.1 hypothetical protein [Streptomyces acidiscabies]MDX3017087.1 hypothetical protein [Streptomyces acidiscabies]MDX3789038.1 hypothetical protein [Streptomyces acidiscabies]